MTLVPIKTCVFFGYSDIGYEALNTLLSMGQKIDSVYTHSDGDENIWFRSVKDLALKNNITTYTHTPSEDELSKINPDIVLCAYYRNILPTAWLLQRPLGSYNLHGSLLPKYRGAQPTNWAVICGDRQSGITLHGIAKKVDAGGIIDARRVAIGYNDTAYDIMKSIVPLSADLLQENWLALLEETARRTPQDNDAATSYPRRTPEDGLIDTRADDLSVHNLIRGVSYPYPGAFFFIKKKKITVWKSEIIDVDESALSGSFMSEGDYPTLKCRRGAVSILEATFDDGSNALPFMKSGDSIDNA